MMKASNLLYEMLDCGAKKVYDKGKEMKVRFDARLNRLLSV